jgi:hypothetical protein
MKAKSLFLLCLFMGLAMMPLSAQNGKNGTGSVPTVYFIDWPSSIPIYCDGVQIDVLTSTNFNSKAVDHFTLGQLTWEIAKITNVIYTGKNEEKFVVDGTQKVNASNMLFYFSGNFKGDKGNHYNVKMVQDAYGNVIEVRSTCH